MTKKITIDPKVLDELLQGCERPEDLLGEGGLMKDLKKALMQRMLGAELGRSDRNRAGGRYTGFLTLLPPSSLDGLTPRKYHQRSRENQTLNRANQ